MDMYDQNACQEAAEDINGKHSDWLTEELSYVGLPIGWLPLFGRMMDRMGEAMRKEEGCKLQILDIKEKFASLRFYYGSNSGHEWSENLHSTIEDILEHAELESGATCQVCGGAGRGRSTSWRATLCDDHAPPGAKVNKMAGMSVVMKNKSFYRVEWIRETDSVAKTEITKEEWNNATD